MKPALLGLAFIVSQSLFAQQTSEVFKMETPITWLGWDLSHAKLIEERSKLGPDDDVRAMIASWNTLMEVEKSKYNIETAFKKIKVEYRIDITKDRNATIEIESFVSKNASDYSHLEKSDIEKIASQYDYKGLTGIGLMFIIESFSRPKIKASVWFTFVNMETGEVILTEKMEGPPRGSGVRNYWSGAVYDMMVRIREKEFETWRKKYQRK